MDDVPAIVHSNARQRSGVRLLQRRDGYFLVDGTMLVAHERSYRDLWSGQRSITFRFEGATKECPRRIAGVRYPRVLRTFPNHNLRCLSLPTGIR